MRHQLFRMTVLITLALLFLTNFSSADSPHDSTDPGGNITLTQAHPGQLGGISTNSVGLMLTSDSRPPSKLARRDYQNFYDEAQALLNRGVTFRETEIQNIPEGQITVIEDIELNYRSYSAGDLFYAFCANYEQMDEQGYCPAQDQDGIARENVRNKLVRARDLFAVLALAEPVDTMITVPGEGDKLAREVGRDGLLAAAREIANGHLIFGNEFLVDALDYRFGVDLATVNAGEIIRQEITELDEALQQFKLAIAVLVHAFNIDYGGPYGTHIADYFTDKEFQLFSMASERLITTLNEKSKRHRLLGENDIAMQLYADAFRDQFFQILAIAQKANERDLDFYDNSGWEMLTNLDHLYAQAQAIRNGYNSFGYPDDYVPIQPYQVLWEHTTKDTGPLKDALADEAQALVAERLFDQNASELADELQDLAVKYDTQLHEICGYKDDEFNKCDGGLMLRNYLNLIEAAQRILQTQQAIENTLSEIQIVQDATEQVIEVQLQTGQILSATAVAIGLARANREVKSVAKVETSTTHYGGGASISLSPVKLIASAATDGLAGLGLELASSISIGGEAGYKHSEAKIQTVEQIEDFSELEVAELNSQRDWQQAIAQATITEIEGEAQVRKLLLRLTDLKIEEAIRYTQWNQLAAEHSQLSERYHYWLDLKAQAEANLTDSYLNKPIYRIMRDQWTVEAVHSQTLAALYAYLTAKALEYEFLRPVPIMDDIFMVRTAQEVNNFMIALDNQKLQWEGNPGERNRYLYRISLAEHILDISGENPTIRYQAFQSFIQQHLISDTLRFEFTTSLLDNQLFDTGLIWNHRIAPKGAFPEQGCQASDPCQGIAVNLLTRQFGNIGDPKIRLTHGGMATYQTEDREIVEYNPGRIRLIGLGDSEQPASFAQEDTSVVLDTYVNDNDGTTNGGLSYLSVATTHWTLEIDLSQPSNQNLDLSQIEDIEIWLDTIGVALPGQEAAARQKSQERKAEFEAVKQRRANQH